MLNQSQKCRKEITRAHNEIEKAKSEVQLAQAEVEQLKGERAQLNAALDRSETQKNAAERRARVMQFIAYGSLGLLIALLAVGSVVFFVNRKKITAALRESESPESKAAPLNGQAASPSSDTASTSFEPPPASEAPSDGTVQLLPGCHKHLHRMRKLHRLQMRVVDQRRKPAQCLAELLDAGPLDWHGLLARIKSLAIDRRRLHHDARASML